jgi:hypothetical protein
MKFLGFQSGFGKVIWVLALVVVVAVAFLFGSKYLSIKKPNEAERAEELLKELEKAEKQFVELQKQDTIGGKTPKETLELFIKAVEERNYELASKYFVIERQEEELKSLQNSPRKNIEMVMRMLNQVEISSGEYSPDNKSFSVYEPILVNFVLYPSGNWKIEEI